MRPLLFGTRTHLLFHSIELLFKPTVLVLNKTGVEPEARALGDEMIAAADNQCSKRFKALEAEGCYDSKLDMVCPYFIGYCCGS
jgi:hypothetical protein